jgi:hypothetical protein
MTRPAERRTDELVLTSDGRAPDQRCDRPILERDVVVEDAVGRPAFAPMRNTPLACCDARTRTDAVEATIAHRGSLGRSNRSATELNRRPRTTRIRSARSEMPDESVVMAC